MQKKWKESNKNGLCVDCFALVHGMRNFHWELKMLFGIQFFWPCKFGTTSLGLNLNWSDCNWSVGWWRFICKSYWSNLFKRNETRQKICHKVTESVLLFDETTQLRQNKKKLKANCWSFCSDNSGASGAWSQQMKIELAHSVSTIFFYLTWWT